MEEVFKLDPSSVDVQTRPHLLVDLFSSSNADEQHKVQPDSCHATMPVEAPSTSSVQNVVSNNLSEASISLFFFSLSQLFTCIIQNTLIHVSDVLNRIVSVVFVTALMPLWTENV